MAALVALTGCVDQDELGMPIGDPPGYTAPPPEPPPTEIALDSSNTLVAGDAGTLPVRVRWTHQLSVPENFYIVGDEIYVSDECLVTLSLETGEERWRACKPNGDGIYTDGGDEIGPAGPGRIRIYTWFNETILVDTVQQRVVSRRGIGGRRPPGFRPFPARLDQTYSLDLGPDARDTSGRIAWSIRTTEPMYVTLGPVRTSTGGIVVTATGLMVSLDYVG